MRSEESLMRIEGSSMLSERCTFQFRTFLVPSTSNYLNFSHLQEIAGSVFQSSALLTLLCEGIRWVTD
jgi:hypothetical protein